MSLTCGHRSLGVGVASLLGLLLAAACGGASSGPSPAGDGGPSALSAAACVDFVIGADDKACALSTDCTFVNALHLCPGDPECGFENPVNKIGAARYAKATANVPVQSVACGAPAPVGCVAGVCVELQP